MAKSRKGKSPQKGRKKQVQKLPTQELPAYLSSQKLHGVFLLILGMLLYANTIGHQYAVDDSIVIEENMFTQQGVSGIGGLLTEDTFFGFFKKKKNLVAGGRYRPLSLVTFAIENEIFGSVRVDAQGNPIPLRIPQFNEAGEPLINAQGNPLVEETQALVGNPQVSHFFNMLLYGLCCWVLYLFVLELLKRRERSELGAYFVAFGTALLFATHPIHTEAVANIKGRDEIMVLLFSLLTALLFMRALRQQGKRLLYWALGGLCFLLALLSKESAVTFLGVVPLSMYFFSQKSFKDIAINTAPLLVVFGIWWVLRSSAVGGGVGGDTPTELMNNPFLKLQDGRYVPFTASERLGSIVMTWGVYLKLLFYPHPLTNDYYPWVFNYPEIVNLGSPRVVLSLLVNVGLLLWAVLGLKKKRYSSYGILIFYGTFSIVSNLVFPIGTYMAERFMFMPSVGFCFAVVGGIYELLKGQSKRVDASKLKIPLIGIAVVALAFSAKTITRNAAWENDFSLFTTDIAYSPNSAKLNNALAGVLLEPENQPSGEQARDAQRQQALNHARKAVELHPTYHQAWLLYGNANVYLKNFEEALAAYEKVRFYKPDHPDIDQNTAVAYRDKGRYLGEQQGDLNGSIQALQNSLEYKDDDPETYRLLGIAYGVGQRPAQAVTYFEKALELKPNYVSVLYNLEMAYKQLGNTAKAQEINARWKAINPNYDPMKGQ